MDNGTQEEKTCSACGEQILITAKKCKHCGEWLPEATNDKTCLPNTTPKQPGTCPQCGGQMVKAKRVEKSMTLQIFGILVFVIGVCLLIFFPIGTLCGIILMLGAGHMGYSRKKVKKCVKCGYFFETA